jgi:glycosyltransferase involved in cell wall biosynthesis
VVVLQKKLVSPLELALLRRKAGRLVFDFDDALWAAHPGQGARGGSETPGELARLLRVCAGVDEVVAGNTFLADKVRAAARRVTVLPTPLDTDRYVPAGAARSASGLPVVGWMGTSCNLFFLPPLLEALAPLAGEMRLSVVSDGHLELPPGFAGGCLRWSPEAEIPALQAMDIGLMPLTDDEYTRGKCGFKLLQYMACGAVPVASDVGFNREIITHGRDGFLAGDAADFARYVTDLVRDPGLRARMAAGPGPGGGALRAGGGPAAAVARAGPGRFSCLEIFSVADLLAFFCRSHPGGDFLSERKTPVAYVRRNERVPGRGFPEAVLTACCNLLWILKGRGAARDHAA